MGNYCSSGQNKKDEDNLSQNSEDSPSYKLASKNKNKNKSSNTLKEAPLVDPEPTSDISNLNAPNVAGHGTKNGNISASNDPVISGINNFQSIHDPISGSPPNVDAVPRLSESLNQQTLPSNLSSVYGKPSQNRRTENDRKIVLYILSADKNHRNEKNILNHLYGELQQYSLSRGFELLLIDLHENCDDFLNPKCWVEEPLEARGGHHLAAACLSEILRHSSTAYIIPIIFLGTTLGSPLLPLTIESQDFISAIDVTACGSNERQLLEKWYILDENSEPPCYCLKTKDIQVVEDLKTLYRVLIDIFPKELRDSYLTTVIEQEINNMVLIRQEVSKRCIWIHTGMLPTKNVDGMESVEVEMIRRLSNIQTGLKNQLADKNLVRIPPTVQVSNEQLTSSIKALIAANIESIIEDHTVKFQIPHCTFGVDRVLLSEIELVKQHSQFLSQNCVNFEIMDRIKQYIMKPSTEPLIIFGPFGCGKSALSAKIEHFIHNWLPECCFVMRYTCLTQISTNITSLIGSITEQVYYYTKLKPYRGPHTIEDYAANLNECIIESKFPIVILIDSLDDALEIDNLNWLPINLSDKVKLIITTATSSSQIDDVEKCGENDLILWNLKERISKQNYVHLKPFTAHKWGELLTCGGDFFSANAQLRLPEHWKNCNDKIPLQAKLFWWFAWLGETNLADISFASVSENVFEVLEKRFGKGIIRYLVSILIASRDGLYETEIIELLKQSNLIDGISVQQLWINICWIMSHGPILLFNSNIRFMDNQLKNIAQTRYANEMENAHKVLHDFYQSQKSEYTETEVKKCSYNKRKYIELPYHAYVIDNQLFIQAIYLTDLSWIQAKLKATKCVQYILSDISLIDATIRKQHNHLKILQHFLETFIQSINYDADQFYPLFKYYLRNYLKDNPNDSNALNWLNDCDAITSTYLDILKSVSDSPTQCQTNGYDLITNLGDGYFVASLNTEREEICVWNVPKSEQVRILRGIPQPTALCPVDNYSAAVLCRREIKIINLNRGKVQVTLKGVMNQNMPYFAYCNDAQHLVCLSRNRMYVNLMNLESGDCITTFKAGEDRFLNSLLVSGDGRILVCGDETQKPFPLLVWHLSQRKLLYDLRIPHHDFLTGLSAITHEGSYVCVVTKELNEPAPNFIVVYDLQSGTLFKKWKPSCNTVSLSISQTNACVIAGLEDARILIWDLVTGNCKFVLVGHTAPVTMLKLDPTGTVLLSADKEGRDQSVRLWELSTGQSIAVHTPSKRITSCEILRMGKYIVLGLENELNLVTLELKNSKISNNIANQLNTNTIQETSFYGDAELNALSVPNGAEKTATEDFDDDDDDSLEDEESSEADDDGRIYKNPRNSPSSECPRDEEQATLLGQKCLRKCSSHEDCKSKKKKCLCDGACGMSCIKPDRECPELPSPEVGEVLVSGREFGAKAAYSCPPSYNVVGLATRICRNGHWTGNSPICSKNIFCGTPPTIEHARHSAIPEQASFEIDSTVQYHCFTGYVTAGFPRAKCSAIDGHANWYGPDIECEPRSCGQPPDPAHGWHAGECYTFGCRITYHCGEGYELVGKSERFCQATGDWSPKEIPTCVLVTSVQCPTPESPKNGKAIYTSLSYNSVVSYECRYGYTLVNETSRRCSADRKWSGSLPSCKEINCGPPGVLYNGWLENIDAGTGLGASIIFRCQPGMLLNGNSSTVCQIDGRWRFPVPECLAPCVIPTIAQGIVIPMEKEIDPNVTATIPSTLPPSSNQVIHGTTLEVVCEDHYEFPVQSSSPPTCINGTWSIIPRCTPARCKSLPKPPKHALVLAPKTEHGMKARFKCKDGFNLTAPGGKEISNEDDYVLTCEFGFWIGESPVCQELFCSFPGYVDHGKILLIGNMGLYDYRPYVKKIMNNKQIMYDCDKGYILSERGPVGATCVGGLWRPTELPQCLPGLHPRLRWSRRRKRDIRFNTRNMPLARNFRQFKDAIKKEIRNKIDNKKSSIHGKYERQSYDSEAVNFSPIFLRNRRSTSLQRYPDFDYQLSRMLRNDFLQPDFYEDYQRGAYTKYYAKIKQKHRKYINSLLKALHGSKSYNEDAHSLITEEPYKIPSKNPFDEMNKFDFIPIPLPNINDDQNKYVEKGVSGNYTKNFKSFLQNHMVKRVKRTLHQADRKRSIQNDDDNREGDIESPKRTRAKEPCEPIIMKPYLRIDILREGRDSTVEFSSGTIVRATCAKEYRLNLQNINGTAKCVRGRWKPLKPECSLIPCSIASTEHGTYSAIISSNDEKGKMTIQPLNTFDEVQSGELVQFTCDEGYNVQGSSELKCIESSWDVPHLPDCVPSPCSLPAIDNAAYQGGYRAGLTIAHGSSVSVQCDGATTPTQMACTLGVLSPSIIHCEPMHDSAPNVKTQSRENEYLGEVDFVSSNQDVATILSSFNKINEKFGQHNVFASDANKANDGSFYQHNFGHGKPCGVPNKVDDALLYKNGEPVADSDDGFESGTEITFNCIKGAAGERTTWKIICDDGVWSGRSYDCANGTCIFWNNEPNVVSFYNDLQIREEVVEFPPGATIVSRCIDIGKYAMLGSNVRTCIHSEWTGNKPICSGLNQENDYAMEKAPTILFRHHNGPISQSNDGKLIIYPGTTVHMECLWMRRFGNPKWIVNNTFRNYPEGWVTDEGRDTTLEYRLSIFHAVADDSGIFTCMTPARHDHSVEVIVKRIDCSDIPNKHGLTANANDTKMGTKIQLSCINGNSLIGATELTCMPSGNWSAPLPVCESIECGDIPIAVSSNRSVPRVSILSREVGGRASFSCQSGFGLRGASETVCLPSGEWKQPFPACMEVQCESPGSPANGYAQGSAPYRAGDVIQFNCNPEFQLQGQPIIACQDNGRWSGILPKCVQACSYPGTAIAGRMSSVKFYYSIGESITFTCDAGLELKGAKMLKCLRNGKWSSAIPTCVGSEPISV